MIRLIGAKNCVKISKFINDTIPSYRIDTLPQHYNEALLKTAQLTRKKMIVSRKN